MLSTFFRDIALVYQMALGTKSENFNTRNPEEGVRFIENLVSSNITKNTDVERKNRLQVEERSMWMKLRPSWIVLINFSIRRLALHRM